MRILAPAKINLFLEVGKKKGKYHPLISLVDPVTLFDIIEIKNAEQTRILFHSRWKIPKNNTVKKTLSLLKERYGIKQNVEINIWKKIPPGSGLGGGSSDAASVLVNLIKIWNLKIPEDEIIKIALEIGSDVPFFIKKTLSVISGFGEIVEPVNNTNISLNYILLVPPVIISTAEVYSYLDKIGTFGNLTKAREKIKILISHIQKKEFGTMAKHMFNRLETPCFQLWKEGKEVMKEVEEKSGRRFFLSGSGGCIFSFFRDKKEAEVFESLNLPKGWKFFLVKSFHLLK